MIIFLINKLDQLLFSNNPLYLLIPDALFSFQMPIENYLLPREKILFWSDFQVTYQEAKYKVYITNLRLLLYNESGLVFKKEEIITETFRHVTGLQFTEQGTINKRGIFKFSSNKGEVQLEGPVNGMRGLFKAIQRQTIDPYKINPLSDLDRE